MNSIETCAKKLKTLKSGDVNLLMTVHLCEPVRIMTAKTPLRCNCCDSIIEVGEEYLVSQGYNSNKEISDYIRCTQCVDHLIEDLRL